VQEKPLKVQLARGSATGQSRVRGWLDPGWAGRLAIRHELRLFRSTARLSETEARAIPFQVHQVHALRFSVHPIALFSLVPRLIRLRATAPSGSRTNCSPRGFHRNGLFGARNSRTFWHCGNEVAVDLAARDGSYPNTIVLESAVPW